MPPPKIAVKRVRLHVAEKAQDNAQINRLGRSESSSSTLWLSPAKSIFAGDFSTPGCLSFERFRKK